MGDFGGFVCSAMDEWRMGLVIGEEDGEEIDVEVRGRWRGAKHMSTEAYEQMNG